MYGLFAEAGQATRSSRRRLVIRQLSGDERCGGARRLEPEFSCLGARRHAGARGTAASRERWQKRPRSPSQRAAQLSAVPEGAVPSDGGRGRKCRRPAQAGGWWPCGGRPPAAAAPVTPLLTVVGGCRLHRLCCTYRDSHDGSLTCVQSDKIRLGAATRAQEAEAGVRAGGGVGYTIHDFTSVRSSGGLPQAASWGAKPPATPRAHRLRSAARLCARAHLTVAPLSTQNGLFSLIDPLIAQVRSPFQTANITLSVK